MPIPPPEIAPIVIVPSQVGVWTAALTAAGIFLTAVASIIGAIVSLSNRAVTLANQNRLGGLEIKIDGGLKELVEAVRGRAEAEGHAAGVLSEQNRDKTNGH